MITLKIETVKVVIGGVPEQNWYRKEGITDWTIQEVCSAVEDGILGFVDVEFFVSKAGFGGSYVPDSSGS